MNEKGFISVNTENIFPIIKKFLYSDQDIFVRELVANAVDACQKIKKIALLGEYKKELPSPPTIEIKINKTLRTITFSDQGIGMTKEEVKKYINQVALSSAEEFVEKYKISKDKDIIGHFGLGFYSAFMVANKVEIQTLSYKEEEEPVLWACEGTTSFEITKTIKKERGTDVILHLNEEHKEYLETERMQSILEKHCKFLPIEIKFDGKTINNTNPIWIQSPTEIKEEDYLKFYKELYPFSPDPLFWIHLNVDYPFELTGVLYFPKISKQIQAQSQKIQLYSRQVFITEEVKDILPEFLTLLHGVIDSPDIPLNVSRSYLQTDLNVKKLSTYITKKVVDKLHDSFKKDRASFEKKWEHIGMFVKYGIVTDSSFYEKAKKFLLLNNINDEYFTIDEYLEKIETTQKDKNKQKTIFYCTDKEAQHIYIKNLVEQGYDILELNTMIDSHFIASMEVNISNVSIKRVDADLMSNADQETKIESVLSEKEKETFKKLFQDTITDKNIELQLDAFSPKHTALTITIPEHVRRLEEMATISGQSAGMLNSKNIVHINTNHSLVAKALKLEDMEQKKQIINQLYDLGLLAQNKLKGERLSHFIDRSTQWI